MRTFVRVFFLAICPVEFIIEKYAKETIQKVQEAFIIILFAQPARVFIRPDLFCYGGRVAKFFTTV